MTRIRKFLISCPFLWHKVVFDNGFCGENYVRYDHILLSYSEGMGNNGVLGNKQTAIERCLFLLEQKTQWTKLKIMLSQKSH